jgi:hypothetical protein
MIQRANRRAAVRALNECQLARRAHRREQLSSKPCSPHLMQAETAISAPLDFFPLRAICGC